MGRVLGDTPKYLEIRGDLLCTIPDVTQSSSLPEVTVCWGLNPRLSDVPEVHLDFVLVRSPGVSKMKGPESDERSLQGWGRELS